MIMYQAFYKGKKVGKPFNGRQRYVINACVDNIIWKRVIR